jgi:hypothetical protein
VKKIGLVFNLIWSASVIILPVLLYLKTGEIEYSFSSYHDTEASDILMYCLLLTSFSFIVSENVVSGLLLAGVAVFNTYDYSIIHHIFAISFFLNTTYHILNEKRYRYIAIPMIISGVLIPIITIFWFEVIALICLALHGFLYTLKILKVTRDRNKGRL